MSLYALCVINVIHVYFGNYSKSGELHCDIHSVDTSWMRNLAGSTRYRQI